MRVMKWQSRQTMELPDKYEIFHYLDNNMKEVGLHHHDFFELYCLVNGSVNYMIEGRSYFLKPGDLLLISSDELHQMHKLDENDYERYVVWISRNWLKTLSGEHTDLSTIFTAHSATRSNLCPLSPGESRATIELLQKIFDLKQSSLFGDDARANLRLVELLLFVGEICAKRYRSAPPPPDGVVDKAISYINENVCAEIRVEELARMLFLSGSRLSHLFKAQTGISIYQYVIKRRLMEAKSLLLTGIPAMRVAETCGFSNYAGFLTLFKKEYNMTPTEYLRLIEGKA